MQVKEITDIVKVLERRITKLESRVAELEYGFEDISISKNGNNSLLNLSLSDISSQTIQYNDGSKSLNSKKKTTDNTSKTKKIIYDKKSLLNMKDWGNIKINGASTHPYNNKPTKRNKEENLSNKESKSIERCDVGKISKSKSQLRNTTSPPALAMLQSTKNEEIITNQTNSNDDDIANCKVEMHYGLLVQFPPDTNNET